MAKKRKFINVTCLQLLFSPKGGIEGALVEVKGAVIQVTAGTGSGALFLTVTGPGKPLRMLAVADHSPKATDGLHPVCRFASFADDVGDMQGGLASLFSNSLSVAFFLPGRAT